MARDEDMSQYGMPLLGDFQSLAAKDGSYLLYIPVRSSIGSSCNNYILRFLPDPSSPVSCHSTKPTRVCRAFDLGSSTHSTPGGQRQV